MPSPTTDNRQPRQAGTTPPTTSLRADYQTLTAAAGWVDVSDRTQLEIEGADRAKFLHNLCTNDVKSLKAGEGCEAFFTNVQGKILGHAFLFVGAHSIVLDSVPGQGVALAAHLDRYLIREDVRIRDRAGEWGQIWLLGPASQDVLNQLTAPAAVDGWPRTRLAHVELRIADVVVEAACPGWGSGYWLRFPLAQRAALVNALAATIARECSPSALEIQRLEAGFPNYGRDIGDKTLPQEVDRDAQAISFKKGCYLGQETVARIDALGHVNRLLRRVVFLGEAVPETGLELFDGDKLAGSVTSAAPSPTYGGSIALAFVRREASQPGRSLRSSIGEGVVLDRPILESPITESPTMESPTMESPPRDGNR